MFEFPKTLITTKIWQSLSFGEFGKGVGFVVKLVAAKVIHQHMLSYFLDNNLWIKKNMRVLDHENHDKWPNITPIQYFCSGFDHANLVSPFRGSKYLPKTRSHWAPNVGLP